MKICLISNFLSLHQINLCNAFLSNDSCDDFKFVSCFGPSGFKKNLISFEDEPFVLKPYQSEEEKRKSKDYIKKCDLVIFGSGDRTLLQHFNGLLFFYSEHFNKDNLFYLRAIHVNKLYKKYKDAYMLCASAFCKHDYSIARLFKNRFIYFGYFPITNSTSTNIENNELELLWVGRGLKWKRLEYAFIAAKHYYDIGLPFHLTIVSKNSDELMRCIKKYQRFDWFKKISFLDFLPNDKVKELMLKSDILLFTSTKSEGWGATLNEAMSCYCLPIASYYAGATNYLITNNVNGFIFKSKRQYIKCLNKVACLGVKDLNKMKEKAFLTISNIWNADVAVKNLLYSVNYILNSNTSYVYKKEPGLFYEKK